MIRMRATVSILESPLSLSVVTESAPVYAYTPTYVVPRATVTYGVMRAEIVDYTPFYDDVSVSDVISPAFARPLTDSISVSDALGGFGIAPAYSEALTATDSMERFLVIFIDFNTSTAEIDADPVTATDSPAKAFTRPDVSDTAVASDAAALTPAPFYFDGVTNTDAVEALIAKVLTDTPTATDAFDRTWTIVFTLSDTVSVTDALVSVLTLGSFSPAFNGTYFNANDFN